MTEQNEKMKKTVERIVGRKFRRKKVWKLGVEMAIMQGMQKGNATLCSVSP